MSYTLATVPKGSPPHVVLVLDDEDESMMYGVGLENAGLRVTHVDTRSFSPSRHGAADVVIVNDGGAQPGPAWEILERLCGTHRSGAVVVLSAYVRADGQTRARAAELGCAAFVAKPCSPASLEAIIHRVLNGERGIEEVRVG